MFFVIKSNTSLLIVRFSEITEAVILVKGIHIEGNRRRGTSKKRGECNRDRYMVDGRK